ncbi:MAG: DEAD/DEAH box helicase [Myxococcota bacterium]|nr:DEAD/DEAH box helicase [Myxococcota bacterium]
MSAQFGTVAADAGSTATFDALPLSAEVRRAVDEIGWTRPMPVQLATFEPAVTGRDLIVQAQTGTGKTAAFGLPLVDRLVRPGGGVQALVLAPTRELALQTAREIERLGVHRGVRPVALYGGASMERQVRELQRGAEIVSGTPGRVLDHLRRGTLDPSGIRVLVLDEADEMLSMGFAEELGAIVAQLPARRQTMLFSATIDDRVRRLAASYLREPQFLGLSSDRVGAEGIAHYVYFVSGTSRERDLVRILDVEDPESAIVFCNTKAETEAVAAALRAAGYEADWLNGDLPQAEREAVVERSRRGELRLMVATDVAARGIDISHLTHVVNYTFPEAVEQYVHRTGRTGRAGRTGTAISLVSPQELGSLYYLRLQYGISPIERSLPTAAEMRARIEADRIAALERTVGSDRPGELDLGTARRLLGHADAERLVAALLVRVLGPAVDEQERSVVARRARRPRAPSVPPPRAEPERGTRASPASSPETASASTPDLEVPSVGRAAEPATPPETARSGIDEPGAAQGAAAPAPFEATPSEPDADADADVDEPAAEGMVRLFVNVGRRDGIRAGELGRLVREHGGVRRSDLGRIRVREKHSFVEVLRDRADAVIRGLSGRTHADRSLVVQVAKNQS